MQKTSIRGKFAAAPVVALALAGCGASSRRASGAPTTRTVSESVLEARPNERAFPTKNAAAIAWTG